MGRKRQGGGRVRAGDAEESAARALGCRQWRRWGDGACRRRLPGRLRSPGSTITATAFCRDVLGLRPLTTPPTFRFQVAWFAVGNGQFQPLAGRDLDPPIPRPIAPHVRDLAVARARLRDCGHRTAEATPIPGADHFSPKSRRDP